VNLDSLPQGLPEVGLGSRALAVHGTASAAPYECKSASLVAWHALNHAMGALLGSGGMQSRLAAENQSSKGSGVSQALSGDWVPKVGRYAAG